jgi:hypothetical protein
VEDIVTEENKAPLKSEYETARERLEAARKEREAEQAKSPEQKRGEALLKFGASMMGKPEGTTKKAKGGAVKSASSRADGIAQRGKTRGMMK